MQVIDAKPEIEAQYTVVCDDDRMAFLPHHFGKQFRNFENLLFTVASKTIRGYKGGYWEFATTESGIPFVFIKTTQPLTACTLSGTGATEMPSQLAGILCTALATLLLVERASQYNISEDATDTLIDRYYALIDAGHTMANACDLGREFFQLVD